jgi:hypothetical protein
VIEAVRALVERIVVSPPEDVGGPPGIERVGDIMALLGTAGQQVSRRAFAPQADARTGLIKWVKEGSRGQSARKTFAPALAATRPACHIPPAAGSFSRR